MRVNTKRKWMGIKMESEGGYVARASEMMRRKRKILIYYLMWHTVEYRCWIHFQRLPSQSFSKHHSFSYSLSLCVYSGLPLFKFHAIRNINITKKMFHRGCKQTSNRRRNFHFHSVAAISLTTPQSLHSMSYFLTHPHAMQECWLGVETYVHLDGV